MFVIGFDFFFLQVCDFVVFQVFYECYFGFVCFFFGFLYVVVFVMILIVFVLWDIVQGIDFVGVDQLGIGVVIWFYVIDVQVIYDVFVVDGYIIVMDLIDGFFGWIFMFVDLDGYWIIFYDCV